MEFQLQIVYLIYTWLIVYIILNLSYFKNMYTICCWYVIWCYCSRTFYDVQYSMWSCDYDLWQSPVTSCKTQILSLKSKINEIRIKIRKKKNRVYYLQFWQLDFRAYCNLYKAIYCYRYYDLSILYNLQVFASCLL